MLKSSGQALQGGSKGKGGETGGEEREGGTWARAHSRTEMMRFWSGWNTWPTLPMGCGSVVLVGKWPRQSSRPNRPRQPLCRSAVLGRHHGTSGWPCGIFKHAVSVSDDSSMCL